MAEPTSIEFVLRKLQETYQEGSCWSDASDTKLCNLATDILKVWRNLEHQCQLFGEMYAAITNELEQRRNITRFPKAKRHYRAP